MAEDEERFENEGGLHSDEEFVPAEEEVSEEKKVDWEEPSTEYSEGEEPDVAQAGIQIGLGPLGPVVVLTQADGKQAEKVVNLEECFLLAGQLTGMGAFIMQMQMQAQMQEAARIQSMMQQQGQGEKRSKGGVIL
jgi:hypothetical protein